MNNLTKRIFPFLAIIVLIILTIYARINIIDTQSLTPEQLDSLKDNNNNLYLAKYDTYFYYGQIIDFLDNKITYNEMPFYSKICYKLFLFTNYFFNELSLEMFLSVLPIIFTCLTILCCYCLIFFFTKKHIPSFCGALLISINLIFLLNTFYGFNDTDSAILFYSTSSICCLLLLFGSSTFSNVFLKNRWFTKLLLILSMMGYLLVLSLVWNGSFFFVFIILAALLVYFAVNYDTIKFKYFEKYSKTIIITTILALGILSFFLLKTKYKLILNFLNFNNYFMGYISEMSIGFSPTTTIFYSILLLFIVLFFAANFTKFEYVFLFIWYFITFFAGLNATRHILFLIIPSTIFLMVLINHIIERFIKQQLRKYCYLGFLIICLGLTLMTIFTIKIPANHLIAMDDGVYDTTQYIKHNYPNYTIISWWDMGHIYDAYTPNKVRFKSTFPSYNSTIKLTTIYLTINEQELIYLLNNLSQGSDWLFIVTTDDLKKYKIFENISNRTYTHNSISYQLLNNKKFEQLEILYCGQSSFKKICVVKKGETYATKARD